MDSRRLVVSSAASCLFSWRLAVFILRGGGLVYVSSGVLGEAAPLACWLVVRGWRTFWWGIRASRARRVDHNAGAVSRGWRYGPGSRRPALVQSRSLPRGAVPGRRMRWRRGMLWFLVSLHAASWIMLLHSVAEEPQ